MQRVNKEIYKVLESILPNKTGIYPAFGSEDAKFPFVVYNCDSLVPDRSKDGIYGFKMQYSIDIYSDKFDTSDLLEDLIIEGLEGYTGQTISDILLVDGSSSFNSSFRHTLNFEISIDVD